MSGGEYLSTLDAAASRTAATAIGMGMANMNAIVARHTGVTAGTYAAGMADSLTFGTKSNWFLPSKDELNEMCFYFSGVAKSDGRCNVGAGVGGFATDFYWSSSEGAANGAWLQSFNYGSQGSLSKAFTYYVRPVRAF